METGINLSLDNCRKCIYIEIKFVGGQYVRTQINPVKFGSHDLTICGELGAGHTVTALYEVVPVKEVAAIRGYKNLRYQEHRLKYEAISSKEVLLFSIRYKEPDEDTSKLLMETLELDPETKLKVSENFLFSAAVAQFALLLRESQFKGTSNFDSVVSLAAESKGQDRFGYREEFISLVNNVKNGIGKETTNAE